MKVIPLLFISILFNNVLTVKIKSKNPDEVLADSNGGDSGEFVRRNQPQEHLIIPLINSSEAEYIPNIDIRKYRQDIIEQLKYNNKYKKL